MRISGGTDTDAFAAYIEHMLGPTLRRGQIVLVDNLSAHTAPRIGELLAARGCRLWFLPPSSPDFSPIELAFAKIKSIPQSRGARTIEALEQAIAAALGQISAIASPNLALLETPQRRNGDLSILIWILSDATIR
jgi:transposase